jgi:DNA-binding beta-propeller fold protein YncE
MTSVPPAPFGVITSPDGRWVFVSDSDGVTVLRAGAASPAVLESVSLPGSQQGLGEALTPDGRYLLVAATSETAVLNVARLESGSAQAVVGSLPAPGGAIEVAPSADGHYVFTSLEDTGAIQVSDLARGSDALLGFATSRLTSARPALVADVPGRELPAAVRVVPGRPDALRHELRQPPAGDHPGGRPGQCGKPGTAKR